MSSVVIWRHEATGVTASWNKAAPYTVFVPVSIDDGGVCDGITTEWGDEEGAIRAAEAIARERLEQMSSEDPSGRRYRLFRGTHRRRDGTPEIRDLTWFGDDQRFGETALATIRMLPVGGTFEGTSEGRVVTVQRVR
jgi:hypothetical protein